MNELAPIFNAVIPVFLTIGAGMFLRWRNWLTEEADASLLRVDINLLVPCFFFSSLLGNEAFHDSRNIVIPPALGFGTVAMGVLVGWILKSVSGIREEAGRRTYAYSVGVFNYGFVPIPLTLLLFDRSTLGVLIVFNVGVEIALWSLGIWILSGSRGKELWKRILNMPLITIVVTLLLNAVNGRAWMPEAVMTTAQTIGQCAIPMGMILIGAVMADYLVKFREALGIRIMASASVLRLALIPALMVGVAKVFPFTKEMQRVLAIQAAMPAAIFPILMSRIYGGDTTVALRIVLGTSALGIVTIPLWLHFAGWFLNL